jgi:hypothetical protein
LTWNDFTLKADGVKYVESLSNTATPQPEINNVTETQRVVNIENLREYLTDDIFIKRGKRKSKADELVMMIQADRTLKDIAVIARFIHVRLLKKKYKNSLTWSKWLPIFYEISGFEKTTSYRQNVQNDALEAQLNALFPKSENDK